MPLRAPSPSVTYVLVRAYRFPSPAVLILFTLRPRNRARIRAHIRATCRLSLGYVRKSTRPSAFTDLLPVSATLLRPRNQERIARRYSTPTFARSALPSFVEKGAAPPVRRLTTPHQPSPACRLSAGFVGKGDRRRGDQPPTPTFPRLRSKVGKGDRRRGDGG